MYPTHRIKELEAKLAAAAAEAKAAAKAVSASQAAAEEQENMRSQTARDKQLQSHLDIQSYDSKYLSFALSVRPQFVMRRYSG